MKIDLKKKLVARTGKVKCVDFHPNFSWILLGLYNGSITIYDYNTQSSVQYLEVSNSPVRACKFMVEKNYIIVGTDDKMIRIFNYNTMEKIYEFEAHEDFIRSIVCHIKEPLFLTSSDDYKIKLWEITKDNYKLIRTYDEHTDFVMKLAINIKDINMFASGSVDKKIKIWSFNSEHSQLTLEGHNKGINTICFCSLTDKSYLASGGDDFIVKIWDYTTKHCLFTLSGHESNLSALCFHNELPILISSAEDQTIKFWNINTGKLEDSKIFGYDVVWDINIKQDTNIIGFGCEEATIVVQFGNEEPLASFNDSQNKIIYSNQNNIYSLNLKQISHDNKDGELITIPPKSLGASEIYPSKILYSPNGRYFSILNENDFIISTSGVYRSSCVGNCSAFSWNEEGDSFIIKQGNAVKIYNNLKEEKSFKPGFAFDQIFGGPLFSVLSDESLYLYDRENTIFIRKIDVVPNKVLWNNNKTILGLICDDVLYLLKVNFEKIDKYIENVLDGNIEKNEEGCEEAFDEDVIDIDDKIINGFFINDIFIYQNTKNKLNYAIHNKIFNISTTTNNFYMLGYLESTNKIYFMNKNLQLISYAFPLSFINYQISVLNKDYETADELLKQIPSNFNDKIVQFLNKFELYEISYKITNNLTQKFSLSLKLKKLQESYDLINKFNDKNEKLKMVSDLAIELGNLKFAEKCMWESKDYSSLFLYFSSIQDRNKIKQLADICRAEKINNIAYTCLYEINDLEGCLQILIDSKKYAEAATFSRTYIPSKLDDTIKLWNDYLKIENENNRNIITVNSPINEENKEKINSTENYCKELYKLVSEENEINNTRQESYLNFIGYDIYNDIESGEKIDIKKIIKSFEEEEEEEEDEENKEK